jgi:O-antigen/teichoic acid export membrane protein
VTPPGSVPSTERASTSLLTGARRSFVMRAVTLPVAAVAGLLAARVTVSSLGVDGYALFALVVGVSALIPIGDLGVGAAVTDAVARRHALGVEQVERVLRTSLRVLIAASLALTLGAWALAALGWWATLLGLPPSTDVEVAVATALTLFAAGLPLGLSSRVLLGAERNDIALAFQGGSGVLTLLIILLAAATHGPLWAYVAAPSAGAALVAAASWPVAAAVSGLSLTEMVRSVVVRARPGGRVAYLAWPMLVITAALPIAFQSDRLLLSHLSNLGQVAVYSVGSQLYGSVFGLVGAAGVSLWPTFARRRAHQPVLRHELIRVSAVFALVGVLLAVLLVAAGPWVAHFMSKGKIDVGYGVFAAFGLLLIEQASWYPTAMLLTDRDGLRFQAVTHVIMMVINLAASAVLAYRIGAAGPILGSVGASFIAVWLPGVWRALSRAEVANRTTRRRRGGRW